MLKAYLQHQLERAMQGKITNALRDCHADGLHSIVFHDEPGNRVRMFYADPGHTLWRNHPMENAKQSLAIHPHHCDLRFVKIHGQAVNYRYGVVEHAAGKLLEMDYKSGVGTGAGSLTPTGRRFEGVILDRAVIDGNTHMRAEELHTIFVERGQSASWLVIEGREDPSYKPVCYTNDPKPDLSGMYAGLGHLGIVRHINLAINNLNE